MIYLQLCGKPHNRNRHDVTKKYLNNSFQKTQGVLGTSRRFTWSQITKFRDLRGVKLHKYIREFGQKKYELCTNCQNKPELLDWPKKYQTFH